MRVMTECINFRNKEKENLNVPPCRDPVVESDLLGCGYKNKYDTRGMSDEIRRQAGYCMFKKGYRFRSNPKEKTVCQTDPQFLGCKEAIERYGDIVDEDNSVPLEKPSRYAP